MTEEQSTEAPTENTPWKEKTKTIWKSPEGTTYPAYEVILNEYQGVPNARFIVSEFSFDDQSQYFESIMKIRVARGERGGMNPIVDIGVRESMIESVVLSLREAPFPCATITQRREQVKRMPASTANILYAISDELNGVNEAEKKVLGSP